MSISLPAAGLPGLSPADSGQAFPASAERVGTSLSRFADALERAGLTGPQTAGNAVATGWAGATQVAPADAGTRVAQVNGTAPLTATDASGPVSAPPQAQGADGVRAAQGLDLAPSDAVRTDPNSGEAILSGLERLREVFDNRFSGLGERIEGARMDVNDMMALQAEVVQYSVLVDVSSKLAGKSTQAMDSLMKGQ